MPSTPFQQEASGWAAVLQKPLLQDSALLGILLLVVGIPVSIVYATWDSRRAERVEWEIVGPPCPEAAQLSRALVGTRPLRAFDYGDVRFARRVGHVSCVALNEGGLFGKKIYRVCQFTSPGVIAVTAAGQTRIFTPGIGQRATVKVSGGKASCVLGGWFAL